MNLKFLFLISLINLLIVSSIHAKTHSSASENEKQILSLIDQYSKARETKDAALLGRADAGFISGSNSPFTMHFFLGFIPGS